MYIYIDRYRYTYIYIDDIYICMYIHMLTILSTSKKGYLCLSKVLISSIFIVLIYLKSMHFFVRPRKNCFAIPDILRTFLDDLN